MTTIYVVCKPDLFLIHSVGEPIAAFSDYSSALAFAKTQQMPPSPLALSVKELIFQLTLAPAPTITPTVTVQT